MNTHKPSQRWWTVTRGAGPIIATAIHDGNELRPEVARAIALPDLDRLREEDPFTGQAVMGIATHVIAHRSRFEFDLNRGAELAIYRTPEQSWGLKVWNEEPSEQLVARSLELHASYYRMLGGLLDDIAAAHGRFVLIDVHSYNHRRDGADASPTPLDKAPDVNIGTFSMPRETWAFLLDPLIEAMRGFDFNGRQLDVRENVAFQGKGEQTRFVHDRYPAAGCAIALEFKKFFMDEWSGEPNPAELRAMREFITFTGEVAAGLLEGRVIDVDPVSVAAPDPPSARRTKVGESGRLHLDRRLRFLIVHRLAAGEVASRSLARRVALNSPAYLVWEEGGDDVAALEMLDRLVTELGEPGMPLLVIAVEDLQQVAESEGSQELTPFVAVVGGGRSARELRARKALIKAIEAIEIDLRHPTVIEQPAEPGHWLRDALSRESAVSDALLVSLPRIHLADDGGIYPQVAHELAVACGDALLRTACAFMDDGVGQAPAHYRSLGRSAYLKAALRVDEKLSRIAASFDFLLSVSPINTMAALDQFVADGEQVAPQFRYRPLTVDPDMVKRKLYRLDFSRLEDPLLERLFTDKRHEIDAQLTMLATRNTPSFRPASHFLYGAVPSALLNDARRLLALPKTRTGKGDYIAAAGLAEAARDLIDRYGQPGSPFAAGVEIRDDIAGLMVTGNRLLVGSATTVPARRLDALLSHEVSTHLLTYINGASQGLSIFRSGLAKYEGVQEGLGVFAEWAVGGLTTTRMRLLAARVVAVDAMQHGAGFMEGYRQLRHDFGFSVAGAFSIASRVHRSGGLAKDAIYLEGFRAIIDRVAAGGSLTPFWLGKIAGSDVPAMEELLQRGLVHAPRFLPEYLARPKVQQRVQQLKAGIGLEQLL